MDLTSFLLQHNLVILTSPGDGHCFLHSTITSLWHQRKISTDLNALKSSIFIEIAARADHYAPFLKQEEKLFPSLNAYINRRKYNSGFGDMLPLVIANIFSVNIRILNQLHHSCETLDIVPAFVSSSHWVTLHRLGDHYNGIAYSPTINDCTFITRRSSANSISSGVSRMIPRHQKRPGVISSDAGGTPGAVIPSQQKRTGVTSTGVGNIVTNTGHNQKVITYTSEDLHALRPTSTNIPRGTRKAIFACGIWRPKQQTHISSSNQNIPIIVTNNRKRACCNYARGVNSTNLTPIRRRIGLNVCALNPTSVCNKTTILHDFILSQSLDLFFLTETWLTGTSYDNVIRAELLPSGYDMIHIPRGTTGGGVAIIHLTSSAISQYVTSSYKSFEIVGCSVRVDNQHIIVLVLYRPQVVFYTIQI
jgi:hypothetical protein